MRKIQDLRLPAHPLKIIFIFTQKLSNAMNLLIAVFNRLEINKKV